MNNQSIEMADPSDPKPVVEDVEDAVVVPQSVGDNPLLADAAKVSFWDLPPGSKFKTLLRLEALSLFTILSLGYVYKVTEISKVLHIINDELHKQGKGFEVPRIGILFLHELPGMIAVLTIGSLFLLCGYQGMKKRSAWRLFIFNGTRCWGACNAFMGIVFCVAGLVFLPEWTSLALECDARDICMPDGIVTNETLSCLEGSYPDSRGNIMPEECKKLENWFVHCPPPHRPHPLPQLRGSAPPCGMAHPAHFRIVRFFVHVDTHRPHFDGMPPHTVFSHHVSRLVMDPYNMRHGMPPHPGMFPRKEAFKNEAEDTAIGIDETRDNAPEDIPEDTPDVSEDSSDISQETYDLSQETSDLSQKTSDLSEDSSEKNSMEEVEEEHSERKLMRNFFPNGQCTVNVNGINNFHTYLQMQPQLEVEAFLNLSVYLTMYFALFLLHSLTFAVGVKFRRQIQKEARLVALHQTEGHAMYPMPAAREVPLINEECEV